jgi:uncharacterized membrane protein HdeD (DUF308 family)
MNATAITIIIMRLVVAAIFAAGAVWLADQGKDGWGWCVFAAIVLGCVTTTSKGDDAD